MSVLHLTRARFALGRPPGNERGVTREYLLHQAVADLFGDRDGRGYIWRDVSTSPACADVLILSPGAPDDGASARMPPHRRAASLVTKPFQPELQVGQRLDFELRVNATRVITTPVGDDLMATDHRPRKARADVWDAVFATGPAANVRMEAVYWEWLQRKLAGVADVGDLAVTERRFVRVRRSLASAPISFVAANLVGDLVIRDPGTLVTRMAEGVGRSRAFGCGLLCLARYGTRSRRGAPDRQ
jgi:CRISPR system Cascade subunit CasE